LKEDQKEELAELSTSTAIKEKAVDISSETSQLVKKMAAQQKIKVSPNLLQQVKFGEISQETP
jgi:hypothetical protein